MPIDQVERPRVTRCRAVCGAMAGVLAFASAAARGQTPEFGDVLVNLDPGATGLAAVSLETGAIRTISSATIGGGVGFPEFIADTAIAVTPAGRLYLVGTTNPNDAGRPTSFLEIDPETGVRRRPPGTAGDRRWTDGESLLAMPDGSVVALMTERALATRGDPPGPRPALDDTRLLRYDPVTGETTVLSGPERGDGPLFEGTGHVAFDGRSFYVLERAENVSRDESAVLLFEVDPRSGDRRVISRLSPPQFFPDGGVETPERAVFEDGRRVGTYTPPLVLGDGPGTNSSVRAVTFDAFGRLIVALDVYDQDLIDDFPSGVTFSSGVIAVDLGSGDRTLLMGDAIEYDPSRPFQNKRIVAGQAPTGALDTRSMQNAGDLIARRDGTLLFTSGRPPTSDIYLISPDTARTSLVVPIDGRDPARPGFGELQSAEALAEWPCLADRPGFDGRRDGRVDFVDLLDFFFGWLRGEPGTDLSRDGLLRYEDYLIYLRIFRRGCD